MLISGEVRMSEPEITRLRIAKADPRTSSWATRGGRENLPEVMKINLLPKEIRDGRS
jgi:hypothetical protein